MSAVGQCRPGYGSAQGSHKASEGTKGCEKKEGACADTHLVTPHSIASAIKILLKKSPEIRSKMAGEINVGGVYPNIEIGNHTPQPVAAF